MVTHITVLLACYNGAKWLPEQLKTLQGQTDPDFSVLIQDDGSTDRTLEIIADICRKDPRFVMAAESGKHLGAVGNFFSLMRQVSDGYTALCDQDDIWSPNRLAACRAAMEKAEEQHGTDMPLLVHSDSRVLREDGSLLQESFFAHQGWDGSANTLNRLLVQNNVTGCTTLINQPLRMLVTEYRNTDKLFMHDWFLAQTASAFGRVIFVPEQLVGYRQHGTNAVGASRNGLVSRGIKALSMRKKGKERISLYYRQAQLLAEAYGGLMPERSAKVLTDFLATRKEWKLFRILHICRGHYLMQSRITRIGQILFG